MPDAQALAEIIQRGRAMGQDSEVIARAVLAHVEKERAEDRAAISALYHNHAILWSEGVPVGYFKAIEKQHAAAIIRAEKETR